MHVIGIDPGAKGGIAVISDDGKLLLCQPTPMIDKKHYDITAMIKMLKRFAVPSFVVYLEKAQAMPKQGVSSTFKTGYGFGLWHGIISALGMKLVVVSPRTWTKEMFRDINGDNTKAKSAVVASRFFPDFSFKLGRSKKPHDGITDAVCIAMFGIRRENKGGDTDES